MNETLYRVSANPHVRDKSSTQSIMLDVILALLPATVFGIYIFGASAAVTNCGSIVTCVAAEYIYQKLMKQKVSVSDLSAAVTGLLACTEPAGRCSFMDAGAGRPVCHHCRKTGFRRPGTEFYEPGIGSPLFSDDLFRGKNDNIYI